LGAHLGRVITAGEAARVLGRPVGLPRIAGNPPLHLFEDVVNVLFDDSGPVLLSEFRVGGGAEVLRKLVGSSTGVAAAPVGDGGVWISGAEHVYVAPEAPPRLAGNTLIWVDRGILHRVEGRDLTEGEALRLAREIDGT